MGRNQGERSRPVSERDAGEADSTSDEVAELLEGAETPETRSAGTAVEAVPSGPQTMPGSASDREERVDMPKPVGAAQDLRNLAPKKDPPRVGRSLPKYQIQKGATALETVLKRGINRGDVEAVEAVELFRVAKGGRVMLHGRICEINLNARVTRLTHDLQALRLQGIELELVGRD